MREYLFRGKRVDDGEWVYGSLITYADGVCFICCEDYIPDVLNKYEVIPETIGQYTGLKDKNGKRIFEGDLLKTDLKIPYSIVIFKNGCFMEQLQDDGGIFFDIFFPTDEKQQEIYKYNYVVGNIYDNPELLEVEENA